MKLLEYFQGELWPALVGKDGHPSPCRLFFGLLGKRPRCSDTWPRAAPYAFPEPGSGFQLLLRGVYSARLPSSLSAQRFLTEYRGQVSGQRGKSVVYTIEPNPPMNGHSSLSRSPLSG